MKQYERLYDDEFEYYYPSEVGSGLPIPLTECIELLNEQADKIAKLENQWISVEDELPDEFGDYLVYGEGFIESDYWNSTIDEFAFRDDATHWMPLPKPPKETQR